MAFEDLIAAADRAAQTHLGGEPVTYAPSVGAPVAVVGIFDEIYIVADGEYNGSETATPVVTLRLEDLPSDPRDDDPTITIDAIAYTVRSRVTDGVGGSIQLALRKVTP